MKHKPYFAVIYMFLVTAVFSSVLIGFSQLTQERVRANQELARERAVLEAFPEIEMVSNKEVHAVFEENFEWKDELGAWVYSPGGQLTGYAVAVEGKGFWASIKGIVGLAADQQTITGIAFYEQSETPGLGARIVEPQFRRQFIGKTIHTDSDPVSFKSPAAGDDLKDNQVHSITGATQTCVRLEKLINDGLVQWQQRIKQTQGGSQP